MIFNEIIESANQLICPFCHIKLNNGTAKILINLNNNENYLCNCCSFEKNKLEFSIRWKYRDIICGIEAYYTDKYFISYNDDTIYYIDNDYENSKTLEDYKLEWFNNIKTHEDLNNVLDKLIKMAIFE